MAPPWLYVPRYMGLNTGEGPRVGYALCRWGLVVRSGGAKARIMRGNVIG